MTAPVTSMPHRVFSVQEQKFSDGLSSGLRTLHFGFTRASVCTSCGLRTRHQIHALSVVLVSFKRLPNIAFAIVWCDKVWRDASAAIDPSRGAFITASNHSGRAPTSSAFEFHSADAAIIVRDATLYPMRNDQPLATDWW